MKFLYKDILKFLVEQPSKESISKKLFQLGHEHELDNEIFDMELTPNRGDCASILGLARDLNVFYKNNNELQVYSNEIDNLEINFLNLATEDCPRISFLEIEIEKQPLNYQPYLENYFNLLGHNKINFFTDISNYISYEMGQPTHSYDSHALQGQLVFENKNFNELFKTLHQSEIKLQGNNCVFTNNNSVINLAGIMGGESTACSNLTNKALIECAYFKPESIIGKSLKYNLPSDAAYKFERGVDIDCHEQVLRRYIKIVEDHVKIKSIKIAKFNYKEIKRNKIPVNVNKINNILGINIEGSEYISYLKKLNFDVKNNMIDVPLYRNDIQSQNDLAEEIARVIGYNNIKRAPFSLGNNKIDKEVDKVKYIKSYLVSHGFYETINFPFSSDSEATSLNLDNPLDSSKSNLRTNLRSSLINNFIYNQRRQKEIIKLFEISDIYKKTPSIKKYKKLAIIIGGRSGNNYLDFFKKLDRKYLNDLLNKNLLEDFFIISEIDKKDLATKKKDKVFYVEVLIDEIPDEFFNNPLETITPLSLNKYEQVSEYPSSIRDISFSINDADNVELIIEQLNKKKEDILKDSFIFDFYINEKKGILKLGFRFIFQSHIKTLSEEDINKKIRQIIKPILSMDGVYVEGM